MAHEFARGIELFNRGEYFACHEALEEVWRRAPRRERFFLQSLIHIAVGFYHCERGNPRGAEGQLRKGLRKLAAYLPAYQGLDTLALHREVWPLCQAVRAGPPAGGFPAIRGLSAARQAAEGRYNSG